VVLVVDLVRCLHEFVYIVWKMLTHRQFHLLFSCKLFQALEINLGVKSKVILFKHMFLFDLRGCSNKSVFTNLP